MTTFLLNPHASIVDAYSGSPRMPKLEGKAQIVETQKYIGKGWYRVKCILLDDPDCSVQILYTNVDSRRGEGGDENE